MPEIIIGAAAIGVAVCKVALVIISIL